MKKGAGLIHTLLLTKLPPIFHWAMRREGGNMEGKGDKYREGE